MLTIGFFQTAHHVDDRRLAGAVGRQNPDRAAKLDPERGALKDHLALRAGPEGF